MPVTRRTGVRSRTLRGFQRDALRRWAAHILRASEPCAGHRLKPAVGVRADDLYARLGTRWHGGKSRSGSLGGCVRADLEAARVANRVAGARALAPLPARAALVAPGRVEPAPVDDHVDVAGVRVDRDPAPAARRAPAHEAPRAQRAAEQPGAVQRVGDRARAVVARVVPLPVAATELVRLVGDAVARGDHAQHGDRQTGAPAAAQVRALEHHPDARVAERRPRGGADDAVRGQSMRTLVALDGALGGGAEDPVDADAERALQDPHVLPPRGDPGPATRAVGAGGAGVRALERRPGDRPDDAVGGQPVAPLEALARALRGRAVDAVDAEAQPLLDRRDARPRGADLQDA